MYNEVFGSLLFVTVNSSCWRGNAPCCREYLDNLALFQGCSDKFLDAACVLLREVQVMSNPSKSFRSLLAPYIANFLSDLKLQFAPEEYLYRAGGT